MLEGQQGAICRRPPRGAGTSHPNRVVSATVTAVSSAALSAVPDGFDWSGCWVTLAPEVDVYIRFGDANVGPATSQDIKLSANSHESFWINKWDDAYFRVIRAVGDGPLKWYRSS